MSFQQTKTFIFVVGYLEVPLVFSKVVHIWLKIWGIVVKHLTMGFTFAPSLLVLAFYNQGPFICGGFCK
jgi:hypothetical protein